MSDAEPNDNNKTKYLAFSAVAITGLFLGFLWGNHGRTGKLTLGEKGVHIEVSDRERIERIIDKILDERKGDPYERQAMIAHMLSVISRHNHQSDMGKKIINAAKESQGPFKWGYQDVEIRYSPAIKAPIFTVCKEDKHLQGMISVQVYDSAAEEFMDVGKVHHALPDRQCGTSKSIVYTGYKELADAAHEPGRLAKARLVVTFPQ